MKHYRTVERLDQSAAIGADRILREQFIENLSDIHLRRELRRSLREDTTKTFLQLREEAVLWAEEDRISVGSIPKKKVVSTAVEVADTASCQEELLRTIKKLSDEQANIRQTLVGLQDKDVDRSSPRSSANNGYRGRSNKDYSNFVCHYCKTRGHIQWKCPVREADIKKLDERKKEEYARQDTSSTTVDQKSSQGN